MLPIPAQPKPVVDQRALQDQKLGKLHLAHLDGLRALAALYVVLFHCYLTFSTNQRYVPSGLLGLVGQFLSLGHVSVAIFIVLSGYCLTLPLCKSHTFDIWRFIKRRARRLLPPYYAALCIIIVLTLLVPALRNPQTGSLTSGLAGLSIRSVVSHFLLLHNTTQLTIYKISSPLWSVALEWQIYFVFAIVMVPVLLRFGILPVVSLMFLAGYAIDRYVFFVNFDGFFLFLFSLGVFGALHAHDKRDQDKYRVLRQVNWPMIGAVCAIAYLVLVHKGPTWAGSHHTLSDSLIGFATLGLLVQCDIWQQSSSSSNTPLILKMLRSKLLVQIGLFSYSLYLIHAPIIDLLCALSINMHFFGAKMLGFEICVGMPLCLTCAYLFHIAFERPFLNAKPIIESSIATERRVEDVITASQNPS